MSPLILMSADLLLFMEQLQIRFLYHVPAMINSGADLLPVNPAVLSMQNILSSARVVIMILKAISGVMPEDKLFSILKTVHLHSITASFSIMKVRYFIL